MLSERRIKELVEQNRDLLEALTEFDRTGKLTHLSAKERVNFSLNMELMRKFREYCGKNNLKMSSVLEELLRKKLCA